jgi:zinc protease
MRLIRYFLIGLAVCAVLTVGAIAQTQRKVHVDFKETVLKNGLRVILAEDHSAPVITLTITYNVGSRDERKGRTGFAHLFEHMMFKGSQNVGNGEHYSLVYNNGGGMNGSTSSDRTNYYNTLPSNQLEMAIFLEADRMRSLAITKDNLDNQRNAVQEERRLFVDNQPYGKSEVLQQEMIYDNFAYKHVTIGSMEDLNAAGVEDVAEFFKIYYAPNNAVLSLVGDFDSAKALSEIQKYFENIPRQPDPPAVDMSEPEQKSERRATIDDPLARLPKLDIAFKAVSGNTPDFYALQVLSSVLQGGQSSRLYQKLVKEKELVAGIGGYMDERRGPGAFYISATLRPGKKLEDAEATIYEEIERLKETPIADWELQKAKNGTRRAFINSIVTTQSRANTIGIFAIYYNDPNLINTKLSKVDAIKAEDVQRVAKQFLKQTNRTVLITMPKSKVAQSAAAGR